MRERCAPNQRAIMQHGMPALPFRTPWLPLAGDRYSRR